MHSIANYKNHSGSFSAYPGVFNITPPPYCNLVLPFRWGSESYRWIKAASLRNDFRLAISYFSIEDSPWEWYKRRGLGLSIWRRNISPSSRREKALEDRFEYQTTEPYHPLFRVGLRICFTALKTKPVWRRWLKCHKTPHVSRLEYKCYKRPSAS